MSKRSTLNIYRLSCDRMYNFGLLGGSYGPSHTLYKMHTQNSGDFAVPGATKSPEFLIEQPFIHSIPKLYLQRPWEIHRLCVDAKDYFVPEGA